MKSHKCPICGKTFTPFEKQLEAWWAVNWCTINHGLLCPTCHAAAEKLGTVFAKEPAMCEVKWGSDIAKAVGTLDAKDMYCLSYSETWRNWVETEHPEWLDEEDRRSLAARKSA